MKEDLKKLGEDIAERIKEIKTQDQLEDFRLKFMVKNGLLHRLTDKLKELPKEEKPVFGKDLNLLKKKVEEQFADLREKIGSAAAEHANKIDLTLPGRRSYKGVESPVMQTMNQMIEIFRGMGFEVAQGPEIEDGFHNFDSLNFPPDHPARDMQDTFFMKSPDELVLRTHTSPVQVRVMQNSHPPIRTIMPGRVYRNEAISARSLAEFYQIEGLYIDKNVTFADLKSTIIGFAKKMYGEDSRFRFRPSFFPFTEPSAEIDISCYLCGGKGCRICKDSGWLEIAGCGMVHPNVLRAGGIDPEIYSGYAFGFGIDRVTLLRKGIDDIRMLYENDVRVMRQLQ